MSFASQGVWGSAAQRSMVCSGAAATVTHPCLLECIRKRLLAHGAMWYSEIALSVSAYDLRCQLILLLLSHLDKCYAQASERTAFFSTTTYDSII